MTCDEIKISEYMDDEMPAEERAAFEAHLESCAACAALLARFERTRVALRSVEMPADLHAKISLSTRMELGDRPAARMWQLTLIAAAALVVFGVVTFSLYAEFRDRSTPPVARSEAPNNPVVAVVPPEPVNVPVPESSPVVPDPVQDTTAPPPPVIPMEAPGIAATPKSEAATPPQGTGVAESEKSEAPAPTPIPKPPKKTTVPPAPVSEKRPEMAENEPQPKPVVPVPTATPEQDRTLMALNLELPPPYFGGTPLDYFNEHLEERSFKPREALKVPSDAVVLSRGKPVTSSAPPVFGQLSALTDGAKGYQQEFLTELPSGTQWVQIDLGQMSEIYAIDFWHFHAADRVYFDVVVQIADDAEFTKNVQTLFNNDYDNSSGLGIGKNKEYIETYEGRLIQTFQDNKGVMGRYVRLYSKGNTTDETNHYVEVEVWGRPAATQ